MLENRQLTGGLMMGFFQFLVQGGVGFVVPLFLPVVLGLSALTTGLWLFPMSLALLASSLIVPRRWPAASPRLVVRLGLGVFLFGTLLLMVGIEPGAGAWVVAVPLSLMGLGAGAMASQLGAVIVSSVPDAQSAEVGGLQNTATNLGSSVGTALAGSVLIAVLSASFLAGIVQSPRVPDTAKQQAKVHLAAGVPFVSDGDLRSVLKKEKASAKVTDFIVNDNALSRVKGLQTALALVALLCVIGLFFTGRLPRVPAGTASVEAAASSPAAPRAP
jgi:Na+/melibiose symporter-like transporter